MEKSTLVHIFKTKQRIFNCNTSMCRYGNTLHFVYWHRKRQTCLWGRYDQKTENCHTFSVILATYCNQSSIVIPLCVGLATYYILFIDTEDVWRMHEDVMTWKLKISLSFDWYFRVYEDVMTRKLKIVIHLVWYLPHIAMDCDIIIYTS